MPPLTLPANHQRPPVALFFVLLGICAVTAIDPPAGRFSWALEVVPGLVEVGIFAAIFKRFRFSNVVYIAIFCHVLVLVYGGVYTYAKVPLGNWAMTAFDLSRNHYDRIGHLVLGICPAFAIREIYLRVIGVKRGAWLYFTVSSVALAIGAFWELLEWWVALLVSSDVGDDFLGSQGDIWDAQWDMLLVLLGAMFAQALMNPLHDRSMAAVCDD